MITSYSFGRMVIAGRTYTSDLIIFPDGRIRDNWYRKSGHLLIPEDLAALTAARPELIIAGTGANGRMALADGLAPGLSDQGIEIRAMETARAVTLYNDLIAKGDGRPVGACFHLTC